jgi:hypothetical protein
VANNEDKAGSVAVAKEEEETLSASVTKEENKSRYVTEEPVKSSLNIYNECSDNSGTFSATLTGIARKATDWDPRHCHKETAKRRLIWRSAQPRHPAPHQPAQ